MTTGKLLILACAVVLPACTVDVQEYSSGTGTGKEVAIRTPILDMSVKADGHIPETGLPPYPGARVRHDSDAGSANITVEAPFGAMKMAVASFEHDDDPEAILAFYRDAMRKYGDVVECRGHIDFRRGRAPVCDERRRAKTIQLAVGTEERHRLVVVTPRVTGTQFSVAYLQAHEG